MRFFTLVSGNLTLFMLLSSIATAQQDGRVRHEALVADFATFDQAYVPALALTKRGTLAACRAAMERLNVSWGKLKDKHEGSMPADPAWAGDFDRVSGLITQASKRLAEDDQEGAHELLEGVREVFLKTRRRHGIDYYLDYLTQFHDTMEKIVMPAAAKIKAGQTSLTSAERAELDVLIEQAKREWQTVAKTSLPPGLFSVDSKTLQKMVEAERVALQTLDGALDRGEAREIWKAAQAIKPPFARLFMLFGDFPQPPKDTQSDVVSPRDGGLT